MSTSELDTFEAGPCPCGKGHIAKHVRSYDNPYSGADVSYSIECQKCRSDWRFDNYSTWLVLRSSEAAYLAAYPLQLTAIRDLDSAAGQVIADYFTKFAAKKKNWSMLNWCASDSLR